MATSSRSIGRHWPWRFAVLFVLLATMSTPAFAQSAGSSRRFSLDLGLGSHLNDGGDVESVSAGWAFSRYATLAATVERSHVPTERRTYPGGQSVTRNGTLTSIGGELRLTIPVADRWIPYGVVGVGVGESVLNVNESFPDAVTRTTGLIYAGGGVRYSLGPAAALFGDAKLVIAREADDLSARLPIRAGVSLRF